MATIGSGIPLLYVEGSAVQTGASGNQRTVKITAKFKVNGGSSSWYGYACNWRARVHNSYGSWTAIKGTESWNGSNGLRTFEQTLTVDVGTTNATNITVGIYTDSQGDNGWDGSYTWTFGVGSTNTAPYWNSGASITLRNGSASGSVLTGTIPENVNVIYASWSAGADREGGTLNYALNHSVNGGGYSQIDFGSDLAHSYTIGAGNEGATYQYYVDIQDNKGAWSPKIYSTKLTKNVFTPDTLASSSSITYSASSIAFTYSGAKNTNGNTTFTRNLSCNEVTVYNGNITATPVTVTIYKSGTVPTTPYVKFDDIKNKFAGASYKGNLTFVLTTTNAYGTKKTSSKTISVNLQTTPTAVTGQQISTVQTESTNYLTVTSTSNKYFIPDGVKVTRVKWNAGSGKLGEAIKYEVYVAYGSGSWEKIADVPSGTNYYNHVVPKQIVSQQFKYLIRTVCVYNTSLYADASTSAQTLHYYNTPTLTPGSITRGATTCTVAVTVKTNSSIPNINTVGTWKIYNRGTTTLVGNSGTLSVSQASQNLSLTGLTDAGQYDLKVTFKDNTGFSVDSISTIQISANSPLLFVNKYGVGVNGAKANTSNAFFVNGGTFLNGAFGQNAGSITDFNTALREGEYHVGSACLNAPYSGTNYGKLIVKVNDGGTHNNSNNWIWQTFHSTNMSTTYTRNKVNANTWSSWQKIYNSGNKPTPSELGAYPQLKTANNFQGFTLNDGSDSNWIRTTVNGIIPYKTNQSATSNGGSSLGTSTWRFSTVYASNLDLNGNITTTGNVSMGSLLDLSPTSNSEKNINFSNADGSHRCKFYGGNSSSPYGIGAYDSKSSKRIWVYQTSNQTVYSEVNWDLPKLNVNGYPALTTNNQVKAWAWWSGNVVCGSDGVVEVGKYLDFHEGSNNNSDYNCRLTSNGGSLVCSGSISQNSDINTKENIVYISEKIEELVEDSPKTLQLFVDTNKKTEVYPFKDFIKNKLKPATFNYKTSSVNTFGFIAQDVQESKIGQLFINEYENSVIDKSIEDEENRVVGTEKTLSFDLNGFSTVIATALQEEIISRDKDIEELRKENEELRKDLDLIKEKLGI